MSTLLSLISTSSGKRLLNGLGKFGPFINADAGSSIISFPFPVLSSSSSLLQQSQLYQPFHTTATFLDIYHIQDEDDFNKRVLKSKKPVVVQFHATWCGPCKMLSPRMEKSVIATKEAVDLAQIDIDDNPDLAMSYSVGAVPAVMAIKDGKVVDKFVGLKDEDQVDTFVAGLLK